MFFPLCTYFYLYNQLTRFSCVKDKLFVITKLQRFGDKWGISLQY